MKKRNKAVSLLLAGILCFSSIITVQADDLSDAKKQQQELEDQKKAAENEKQELVSRLETITSEVEDTETQLEAKELEISETQDKLDLAKIDESEQYASMKVRIKYMYENGGSQMLQVLFEAKSIGDFLNKAEYIQQVTDYDRQKLEEFQATVKEIEDTEAKLKEEETELTALRDDLINKKSEVESLVAEITDKVSDLDSQLTESTKKVNELIAAAEARKKQQQAAASSGTAGPSQIIGNGVLAWPTTSTRVTSTYGWRTAPVAGATSLHDAIDIGAPIGSPVYAAADGTVITAKTGYNGGRGNYVMIDHGNGLVTRYQHLNSFYVSVGQTVTKGQNIAEVGNTGASSGPHLDFAIYVNGKTVDPLTYY